MKRWTMVMMGVALLAGCATAPDKSPDWVAGESAKYPKARYLTGHGQADHQSVARDRARADLVKVFEANIAEESHDLSSATRESSAGVVVKQSNVTKADRNVVVTTARAVEGIEIAEMWQEEGKSYHALAVLDRLKAGEAMRGDINRLDDATARELQNARSASDLLMQIAAASRATEAQEQRIPLQRDLRVIDPTGVGVPPRWELAQLRSDQERLLQRVRLSTRVNNDPVGNLGTMLSGAVASAGFSHATTEDAPYQVTASLVLNESQSGGWFWATGVLEVGVKEKSGAMRGARQYPVKASALQPVSARQRAMGEVDRILRAQLRDIVINSGTRSR